MLLDPVRTLNFLVPLLVRLYLVPVLRMAGTKKFANFE
jgi:putative oxidoreductase